MTCRVKRLSIAFAYFFALLVSVSPILSQGDVVAFGDSITEGPEPFDEENRGGYPARLQDLLRAAGDSSVDVLNEGKSFEMTAEGLSRIDSVLAQHGDRAGVFIIMEGTNDVGRVASGRLSIESVVQNLDAMAAKVRNRGIDALYATIIPRAPWATSDRNNVVSFDLTYRLRELTSSDSRDLAEPWEVYLSQGGTIFDTHYFCCDVVGHPNAAGFQLLAEIFADKILGVDSVAPVVSTFYKTGPETELSQGDRLFVVLHESGAGIRQSETYFTINGRPVQTEVLGSERRVDLRYRVSKKEIECAARIAVRTEDEADPPNLRHSLVAELSVAGAEHLKGDVNGDCRVDGLDLTLFGLSFGSLRGDSRFSAFADTNRDRAVDGEDLARLARNFGKSSSGS